MKALSIAMIIPTYNNERTIASVIKEVQDYCYDVIVINDGCTDSTDEILRKFGTSIRVKTHPINWGKGVGLMNGLSYAKELGFRYAITIDSDGQHFPSDIPGFVDEIEKTPDTLLVGARNLRADGMPGGNTFANKFSNFWYKLETGIPLTDTQSGFRLYPLDEIDLEGKKFTGGYEFELEAIVFAAWDGIPVRNIPVHVIYQSEEERVSHFRPFRDFGKISVLNTILVGYCLFWRWPAKLLKYCWENLIHAPESNLKVAESVALGVFMGIVPVWGYQLIIALALAHFLKLNKVITGIASNISIPPMIPFIVFGSYWTGCKVMGSEVLFSLSEFTLKKAGETFVQYLLGSVVFGAIAALVIGLIAFFAMEIFGRGKKSL